VTNIGYFAPEAFLNTEKYKGKAISLTGDELTYEQMRSIFKDKCWSPCHPLVIVVFLTCISAS
jgi:hypothetical protein